MASIWRKKYNKFHYFANAHHQRNNIEHLKDEHGNWLEDNAYLNPMVSDYFAGLFTSEVDDTNPLLLKKVMTHVTSKMNDTLNKLYTVDEVKKEALCSIIDMKPPGLDDLHAIFFKKIGIY